MPDDPKKRTYALVDQTGGDGKFGYRPQHDRGYAPSTSPQAKLPRPADAGPADSTPKPKSKE